MTEELKQQLNRLAEEDIGVAKFSEPLSRHSSWRIGGPADLLIEPDNPVQIARILKFLSAVSVPCLVIGQGTNLLFDDEGVRGVVLKIGERMAAVSIQGRSVSAESGVWVPRLSRMTMRAGLSGLEHCIGIPGTLGGLVMMNGGSQRRGIGENIISVTVVNRLGQMETLDHAACRFSYRHSALQGSGCVVVRTELMCQESDVDDIRRSMLADLRARRRKFPRKQPNCGSVFLSTDEMHKTVGPPGKIIEQAGLKGVRIGQAEVSRQHANFIINRGGARSMDVLRLIRYIREEIRRKIGFELNCEVRYVNSKGDVAAAHLSAEEIDTIN